MMHARLRTGCDFDRYFQIHDPTTGILHRPHGAQEMQAKHELFMDQPFRVPSLIVIVAPASLAPESTRPQLPASAGSWLLSACLALPFLVVAYLTHTQHTCAARGHGNIPTWHAFTVLMQQMLLGSPCRNHVDGTRYTRYHTALPRAWTWVAVRISFLSSFPGCGLRSQAYHTLIGSDRIPDVPQTESFCLVYRVSPFI